LSLGGALVNADLATAEVGVIHPRDGVSGITLILKGNETKSSRAASFTIGDDSCTGNFAIFAKCIFEVTFGDIIAQVSDE